MIVTSTDGIEGRHVSEYLGIVSGEAVMGTNVFRDLFAGITDLVGGRSGTYEEEIATGKGFGARGNETRSPCTRCRRNCRV